jgi:hypothetical protein
MNRRTLMLGGGGAALVVVAIVVVAVLVLGGSSGTSFASLVKTNVCTVRSFPNQGRSHTYKGVLVTPDTKIPYKTDPATSGPHYQVPAPWGVYTEPIPAVIRVHNLEHGGIEVLYGTGISETVRAQIENDVRSDWKLMIMAPYPKLGNDKIYYVAWQHWIACTGYQKAALQEARHRWRNKGPESPIDPTVNKQPDFGSS